MTFDVSNPLKPTIVHDPQATLDYQWNLADLIDDSDVVVTATFEAFTAQGSSAAPTGVPAPGAEATLSSIASEGKSVWAWLTITDVPTLIGVTIGVTCHYTTANGRTDDRTLFFKIKDR